MVIINTQPPSLKNRTRKKSPLQARLTINKNETLPIYHIVIIRIPKNRTLYADSKSYSVFRFLFPVTHPHPCINIATHSHSLDRGLTTSALKKHAANQNHFPSKLEESLYIHCCTLFKSFSGHGDCKWCLAGKQKLH